MRELERWSKIKETTEMGFFLVTDNFCKLSVKFETLYKRPRSLVQITLTRFSREKILFQKVNSLFLKKKR